MDVILIHEVDNSKNMLRKGVATMLTEIDEVPSIKLADNEIRLELDEPTAFSREVAEKELRETPEVRKKAIAELKILMEKETDLVCPLHNEDWLVRFLRPTKFYPESARDLIKRYYAFKIKHHNIYDNLVPENLVNLFSINILTVFSNRDQLGRRVLVMELGKKWNHKKVCLDEVFRGLVLFLEMACLEADSQINGGVVIFDMDGLSLSQTMQFTPPFAKRMVDWLQDAIPLRVKAIHIVNQPKIFNMVFALFKPFLREKLRSRIYFHGTDRESLHQHMSPKVLPICYGGLLDLKRPTGEDWHTMLMKCTNEFKAINSYGYNKK